MQSIIVIFSGKGMSGKTLFIIPIYQHSIEKHNEIMDRKRAEFVKEAMEHPYHLEPEYYETVFNQNRHKPWSYSQHIGYVEISLEFQDIKAYYYFVKAKNVTYTLKDRTMEYRGKIGDVSKLTYSNENIRQDIREFIALLPQRNASNFKDRFFATGPVEILLDAIDFHKLTK